MATNELFNSINPGDEGTAHLLAREIDPKRDRQKDIRPGNAIKIHGSING